MADAEEKGQQTTLRFSKAVRDRLTIEAKKGKTRTAQIEEALIRYWAGQRTLSSDTLTVIRRSAEQIIDAIKHAEAVAVEPTQNDVRQSHRAGGRPESADREGGSKTQKRPDRRSA